MIRRTHSFLFFFFFFLGCCSVDVEFFIAAIFPRRRAERKSAKEKGLKVNGACNFHFNASCLNFYMRQKERNEIPAALRRHRVMDGTFSSRPRIMQIRDFTMRLLLLH